MQSFALSLVTTPGNEEGGDGSPDCGVAAVEKSSTKTAPNRVAITFNRVHALVIAEWKIRLALLNCGAPTRFTGSFMHGPAVLGPRIQSALAAVSTIV